MFSVSEGDRARARRIALVCARAYTAGKDAIARRDYDLARTAFRWARRADPGNPVYIHAEALLAQRMGNLHEAERLLRRVVDVAGRAFGDDDPRTAMVTGNLVNLYERMGRHEEARSLAVRIAGRLDRAAAARSSVNGLSRIAEVCIRAGRPDDALLIHWQANSHRRTVFGRGHAKVAECLSATNALAARLRRTETAGGAGRPGRGSATASVPMRRFSPVGPTPQTLRA